MEKISPKTKAIYDLLRADFDAALSKSSTERNEKMVSALARLDSKLDQLFGRIDDIKIAIGVDQEELRGEIGADRGAASSPIATSSPTAPPSPRAPPASSKATPTSSGSSGSDGPRFNIEHRSLDPSMSLLLLKVCRQNLVCCVS